MEMPLKVITKTFLLKSRLKVGVPKLIEKGKGVKACPSFKGVLAYII
jgi:hypothetical protein